jgi:hypothetical protein
VNFGEPIVMLGKRSGVQICEPTKCVIDGGVPGIRTAGRRISLIELIIVSLGHVLLRLRRALSSCRLLARRFPTRRLRRC